MDNVFNGLAKFSKQVAKSTDQFTPETWGVLAVVTVVVGYLLLRGNILNK